MKEVFNKKLLYFGGILKEKHLCNKTKDYINF